MYIVLIFPFRELFTLKCFNWEFHISNCVTKSKEEKKGKNTTRTCFVASLCGSYKYIYIYFHQNQSVQFCKCSNVLDLIYFVYALYLFLFLFLYFNLCDVVYVFWLRFHTKRKRRFMLQLQTLVLNQVLLMFLFLMWFVT